MSTPMFRQYQHLKSQHRDAILLFRLGDFYEMFADDAHKGARLLGLTLTQRQGIPMCGIPHHAAHSYIAKLLHSGNKIAVCEQTSIADGKNLVERKVVEVLTPASVYDLDFLEPNANSFLLALTYQKSTLSLGWCDASTGELILTDFPCTIGERDRVIQREITRLDPRELLVQESLIEQSSVLQRLSEQQRNILINRIPDWSFNKEDSFQRLCSLLQVQNLKGFGIQKNDDALLTSGVLIEYLETNAQRNVRHVHNVKRYYSKNVVVLDDATIRNLELVRSLHVQDGNVTLLKVLDNCKTPMGSRRLRQWILSPLRSKKAIEKRFDRVTYLYKNQEVLTAVQNSLNASYDIERLVSRLGMGKAHAKDLNALADSISAVESIAEHITHWYQKEEKIFSSLKGWQPLRSIKDKITSAIVESPPVFLHDGGVIRSEFDDTLKELRQIKDKSSQMLQNYLHKQQESTGITNLKLKYNRVLGHFFETTKNKKGNVPNYFIQRQSLSNAERYTTTELSELESRINNASEHSLKRERELFQKLCSEFVEEIPLLSLLARIVSEVDVYASFAWIAIVNGYTKPEFNTVHSLKIEEGRHPVVETTLSTGSFVTNDISLSKDDKFFALITGPNMAGKSTILRQTALIALMAQIGSYVPALHADLCIVDRIFCRVGSSDNLAHGESTFLVEMSETASIIRNATESSLVIIDEIGRGTNTNDGLALAWAICEYILKDIKSYTLFATHYHELTQLQHSALLPLTMSVEQVEDKIIFFRKLEKGMSKTSYGIDVARLAGIPNDIIVQARKILAQHMKASFPLQQEQKNTDAQAKSREAVHNQDLPAEQYPLFLSEAASGILEALKIINPDTLSPREALDTLYQLKTLYPAITRSSQGKNRSDDVNKPVRKQ